MTRSSSQRPRRQKAQPVCFHYFIKAQRFVVIVRVFTDLKDVLNAKCINVNVLLLSEKFQILVNNS